MLSRNPFLFILSAPSGAGKTTLCRSLVRRDDKVRYSVSATTRPRRGKEEDGKAYHFVSDEEFSSLAEQDGLLEWEEVYGYRYGTPKAQVQELLAAGFDVVLDMDINGALHLKERYPESVTVFLLPPSLSELRRRLTARGRDDRETIEVRLARAEAEIERAREFDYVVVNDSLSASLALLQAILDAERARAARIKKIKLTED
ncbi:guanylate kinase [candidate division TA06 bacterium B3_TA06]|uniref:Guanylate kinase n=1 Tax=candidate division TA06 bacterium B3_TA06 TaxID=2012487 RepID=A0A532VB86_UNCT6|nr:MAG: guanylate kinase [candidate division TA06 bacterium B3_TA06]